MADATETLDYPGFLQDALRDMVRRVLAHVAENGLPGEHYFYITFQTRHPGVRMPPFLRDQYPEAIRIVLQNQYWDLEVDETAFSVSLNFAAARQRLTVPFAALLEFHDPTANLVMAFDPEREAGAPPEPEAEPEPAEPPKPGSVIQFDPKRRK
ncbi:MAG TPA: ClpXP protease specificity-enhancing factor SspB [Thermoanaerobaculia bacterium]|nr:ClpXP protease specificity-enhancing factor SspB [Thermoanaerobaculia bacterium]